MVHFQDLKKLDVDQIAAKEAEELQKERRELQAKLKSQEKKVDYFERAKRLEEIPFLQTALKEKQIQDQNFWEQQENDRIEAAIEERRLAVTTKDRLSRVIMDKNDFLAKLKSDRKQIYDARMSDFEKLLSKERKKRLAECKEARKQQRRAKFLKDEQEETERKAVEAKQRQEAERQRLEEIAIKEKERIEKIEKEEQDKKRREHLEMLERVAAMQKTREEEIERKLQEEKDNLKVKGKEDSSWRRGGNEKDITKGDISSSWRGADKLAEDEPKKMEAWRRE